MMFQIEFQLEAVKPKEIPDGAPSVDLIMGDKPDVTTVKPTSGVRKIQPKKTGVRDKFQKKSHRLK